jgi:hypothetical protein
MSCDCDNSSIYYLDFIHHHHTLGHTRERSYKVVSSVRSDISAIPASLHQVFTIGKDFIFDAIESVVVIPSVSAYKQRLALKVLSIAQRLISTYTNCYYISVINADCCPVPRPLDLTVL